MGGSCACGCASRAVRRERLVAPAGEPIVSLCSERGVARVDLRVVAHAWRGSSRRACLADVWVASRLADDLLDIAIDLVGDDGFRLGSKGFTITGAQLAHGYIDARTRDVTWDASLGFPCFCQVNRVATVVATPLVTLGIAAAG